MCLRNRPARSRRGLYFSASVAWFHAQRGAALSGLKQVYAEAERKGFHLLARRAAFMQAHLEALSYTNLPRWLYGHVEEK
jgi:hypothetical protein